MLKASRLAIMLSLLVITGPARATSINFGFVAHVFGMFNGAILFYLVDATGAQINRTGLATCASTMPGRWAFDGSTPAGHAQLDVLMMAWTNHSPVSVAGQDSCAVWNDTETVGYFNTVN